MQTKRDIIADINQSINSIGHLLLSLPEEVLRKSEDKKWSIAENIIHLNKSVAPINMALGLPKFSFILFGRSKEQPTYEQVVSKYQEKLKEGAVATGPYVPSERSKNTTKANLIREFKEHHQTLVSKLSKWSEEELDKYRLPHPIIGKISIREMLFFTAYHIKHHLKTIESQIAAL